MDVAVSGSSGLLGSEVVRRLEADGHGVRRIVRRPPVRGEIGWDPASGTVDRAVLGEVQAVVHLAGEDIAGGRWTAERKRRIRESRIAGTRAIAGAVAAVAPSVRTLVVASAIGWYGDRGELELDERSAPGSGFLPELCADWEDAAVAARAAAVRVVHLRFGVVLSARGGALRRMLLPFRLGLGGRIGSGRQWMSWISLDDAARAILHVIETRGLGGPVNAVSPEPVTNLAFTKALGRALRRPTLFPMPAALARLAFGELADALLLASARVRPVALLGSGFRFEHPDLPSALVAALRA